MEFNVESVNPIYNAKPAQVEKVLKHVNQVSTNRTQKEKNTPDLTKINCFLIGTRELPPPMTIGSSRSIHNAHAK